MYTFLWIVWHFKHYLPQPHDLFDTASHVAVYLSKGIRKYTYIYLSNCFYIFKYFLPQKRFVRYMLPTES